jgi:hypothetical protein
LVYYIAGEEAVLMIKKLTPLTIIPALIITLCFSWFCASGAQLTWTQTTVTDFNAGTLSNVEVIDVGGGDGDVQITTTTVTLGNSTNNTGAQPYSNDVYIQEDSSYTLPYNGEVTSWSYYNSGGASTTNNARLEFLSGSGATWTMEAKSGAVSIGAGTNTFIVSLPVSAGWQIGLYTGTPRNLYYDTSSGMTVTRRPDGAGDFNVGDSRADFSSNPSRHLPITVDLRYFLPSGTLASQVLDTLTAGSTWDELSWNETLPANTNITFEVRASNTPFAAGDASPTWTDLSPADSPITTGLPSGQYMQWRATLSTTDTSQTPVLHDVTITYTTNNPPDIPTLNSPSDGATDVVLTPNLVFDYSDPDSDDCTSFDLQVDDDAGFGSLEIDDSVAGAWSSGSSITYNVTTPLAPSTQYFWRANVFDGTDWSGWSDGTWDFTTGVQSGWSDKSTYYPDEDVTVTGIGFPPDTDIHVYVKYDSTWTGGESIGGDDGDGMDIIHTGPADGSIAATIWTHPLTIGEYDIVFDVDRNGTFDVISDVVDDPHDPGFTVTAAPPPPRRTVGGEVYPIDKSALLLPWLGLGIALTLASGGLILARRAGRLR